MADTTALKNRIRAAIKANDNQEITGPVLQQALLDMVDELNGATETEASQRQSADNTLQQNINTEAGQRQSADSTLSGMINSEASQRQSADNTLQQNINTEAQQRQSGDSTLQQGINTERQRAQEAEQTLQQNLSQLQTTVRNLRDAGYAFGGIAVTSTNPGVPSGNCFYIVRGAGTYTRFKNADDESIVLENDGLYVLTYEAVENNYWEYNLIIGIDDNPVNNSSNIITSNAAFKGLKEINDNVNSSLLRTNELEALTTLSGYPRTNGAFFSSSDYISNVYDVSNIEKLYISGTCRTVDYIALIAFSSDQTFESYTKGYLRQPSAGQKLKNYEVLIPEHTGNLYACVLIKIQNNDFFNVGLFNSYIDVNESISQINSELDNVEENLQIERVLQGTIINGYPRNTGTMFGDVYRSKVYNVSNKDKILVSGTEDAPSAIVLAAFSTDPTFTTFTHGYVSQPEGISQLTDYEVQVPQHTGTLYACVAFASNAAQVEIGGNIFTEVKADDVFNAQEFENAINESISQINSELDNIEENLQVERALQGTIINGYPRKTGIMFGDVYRSKVYDVSNKDRILISGTEDAPSAIVLAAFSTDPTFATFTHGYVSQPEGVSQLTDYEVAVPQHTGTLYACVAFASNAAQAEIGGNIFTEVKADDIFNAQEFENAINESISQVNDELNNIKEDISYKNEIEADTIIEGYPRINGTMSGNIYRSKVYDVSDINKIFISGTEDAPSVILLAAFSTDPTFTTFTHGKVNQPEGVSQLTDYEVAVPQHTGTLYACIPFASNAAQVETGGNIFTEVKTNDVFNAQEFENRLKDDEDRISALENTEIIKAIINCVGDSITQGQTGILNLREGTTNSWNRYEYYLQQFLGQEKYTVKNYGWGGNGSSTIFASTGWEGIIINQDITLKGDKTPVAINDVNALTDTFLNEPSQGFLAQHRTTEALTAQTKCSVFGIPCNLSRSNNILYLERQDAVNYDTIIPSGTALCFDGVLDKEAISVLFTGENNINFYTQNSGADFVTYMKNIVSKISNGKYIIIGLHVAATQLSDINDIKTANNALRKEFGNRFIDLQKELSSYAIFQHLDYTPTDDSFFTAEQLAGGVYSDEGAIALGIQPSSFWREVKGIAGYTVNDSIHMSGVGYKALAFLIYKRLITLGFIN